MIIMTQKVDPHAEGGARKLIKESDRHVSSLEKSSTDNNSKFGEPPIEKHCS
jgi:hypothetical protein